MKYLYGHHYQGAPDKTTASSLSMLMQIIFSAWDKILGQLH